MESNRKGLGRGIDALFQDIEETQKNQGKNDSTSVQEINLDDIRPNPHQPRHKFDQQALEELAVSISESGVLQPIVLRPSKPLGFEIVAGERRVRASKIAGKKTIPAIVRELTEEEMIELAVLENLQREDLTALEEAEAYQMMMDKLNLNQAEVAQRLGKSRPHVANLLRLLKLPQSVKGQLNNQDLSMGQARTLLGLKDKTLIVPLANTAIKDELTVRQLEKRVSEINADKKDQAKEPSLNKDRAPNYIRASEEGLIEKFGTDVHIKHQKNNQGKIVIEYTSESDLARLLDIIGVSID